MARGDGKDIVSEAQPRPGRKQVAVLQGKGHAAHRPCLYAAVLAYTI